MHLENGSQLQLPARFVEPSLLCSVITVDFETSQLSRQPIFNARSCRTRVCFPSVTWWQLANGVVFHELVGRLLIFFTLGRVSFMKVVARQTRGLKSRSGGFTLIELVMVMVILIILAGIAIPIIDWVRRSANYAAASSNQQATMSNLQLFRTTYGNGQYPDRFDSLLDADGLTQVSPWLHNDLRNMITVGELDGQGIGSTRRSGFRNVMDHSNSIADMVQGSPQNSGVVMRNISTEGSPTPVAQVLTNPGITNTTHRELLRGLYPADPVSTGGDGYLVPDDVRLYLFGIGPANTAIGRTLTSPPLYTELDPQQTYGRYVVCVAAYEPRAGRRAQVKALLDPKGRLVNRQVSEFWQSMNPE